MKLADVDKVRLLGQRRTKLLGDLEHLQAADSILVSAVAENMPGTLQISLVAAPGEPLDADSAFRDLKEFLIRQLREAVDGIEAELKRLGVEP